MRSHICTPQILALGKLIVLSVGNDVEYQKLLFSTGGHVSQYNHTGKLVVSTKAEHRHSYNTQFHSQKKFLRNVSNSIIHQNQTLKIAQMSIKSCIYLQQNGWISQLWGRMKDTRYKKERSVFFYIYIKSPSGQN